MSHAPSGGSPRAEIAAETHEHGARAAIDETARDEIRRQPLADAAEIDPHVLRNPHERTVGVDVDARESRRGTGGATGRRVRGVHQLERPVVARALQRIEDRRVEVPGGRAVQIGGARQREQEGRADGRPSPPFVVKPAQFAVGTETAPALFESLELGERPFGQPLRRVAEQYSRIAAHRVDAVLAPVRVGACVQGHFDPVHGGGAGGDGGVNTVVGGVGRGGEGVAVGGGDGAGDRAGGGAPLGAAAGDGRGRDAGAGAHTGAAGAAAVPAWSRPVPALEPVHARDGGGRFGTSAGSTGRPCGSTYTT